MRMLLAVPLLLLLSSCASAPPMPGTAAQMRDIDAFIGRTLRTLPEVPGLGIAIVRDGRSLARGYGYADVERRVPADANTGYYNGSNTKAYTALLCAMLAQEGVLDLDVPVTRYVPELRFPESIRPEQTTLRRFLSHTSAIENGAIVFRTAYSGEQTPQELVRVLALSKPAKEGFRYDNLGYVVASLVVERVTGRKWQDALAERVFAPLGMTRTTAYMAEARRHPIAAPYALDTAGEPALIAFGWKDDSMMHAAGGTVTTPADLAKWMESQLTRGRRGSRQVLPAAAFAETQRQQVPAKRDSFLFNGRGYGLGWYQSDLHGQPLIYHGGGFTGWRSVYSFLPERNIAVGAMTNLGLSHSPLELVSAYIYDRLMDVPNVDATYAAKLAELRARFDRAKKSQVEEAAKRAGRTWTLSKPREAYVGRYESPAYGTFTIEQRGEKLVVSIGRLSAELEPFTQPESARVELTPGDGEVLQFTAEGLKWGEELFVRR